MSENKIGFALVHEICPICGKPMNEQILMNSVLSKKYAKEIENVHGKAIGFSTSRELNRVSPNNIAEQSTRYVYENDTICRPHWLEGYNIVHNIYGKYIVYKDGKEDNDINHKVFTYFQSCKNSFDNYRFLVNAGLHRQDARGVLPIDTATKCIYTYSINE